MWQGRKVGKKRVALLIDDLTADWTNASDRPAWQPEWSGPPLQILATSSMFVVPDEAAWNRVSGRSMLSEGSGLPVRIGVGDSHANPSRQSTRVVSATAARSSDARATAPADLPPLMFEALVSAWMGVLRADYRARHPGTSSDVHSVLPDTPEGTQR